MVRDRVSVTLTVDATAVPVALHDIGVGGAAVIWSLAAGPAPTIDQLVGASFLGEGQRSPVHIDAVVVHTVTRGERCLLGLQFEGWEKGTQDLPPRLVGLFNERMAFRVSPSSDRPVRVRLSLPDVETHIFGDLHDLCITGVGVTLAEGVADHVDVVAVAHLRLRLPGSSERSEISAVVQNRRTGGARAIVAGLCFQLQGGAADRELTKRLQEYVLKRQRQTTKVKGT